MEQRGKRRIKVALEKSRRKKSFVAITAIIIALVSPVSLDAQEECGTVKDCAEFMVALANELKIENAALLTRIVDLETALNKQATDHATALENRIQRLKNGMDRNSHPGGNGQSGLCPSGTYMVGARWKADPGGCCGQISWFGPICRTMP